MNKPERIVTYGLVNVNTAPVFKFSVQRGSVLRSYYPGKPSQRRAQALVLRLAQAAKQVKPTDAQKRAIMNGATTRSVINGTN